MTRFSSALFSLCLSPALIAVIGCQDQNQSDRPPTNVPANTGAIGAAPPTGERGFVGGAAPGASNDPGTLRYGDEHHSGTLGGGTVHTPDANTPGGGF